MSIFRKNSTRAPPPAQVPVNENAAVGSKHPFFGRKQASTTDPALTDVNGTKDRRSSSSSHSHVFSKNETLTVAHTKLKAAVAAEKAADDALIASRRAVKEAKAEIQRLEIEAKEEARLAKMKMATASRFRREGDKLGKH